MSEKEFVEMLFKKYKKITLNMRELSDVIGSYSQISKLFGGKDAISERVILEQRLLPKWRKTYAGNRYWTLIDIAAWVFKTKEKGK